MSFEIVKNEQYNSLEITFDCKPAAAVRELLKARRFRWNGARGIWYGYADTAELAAALNSADGNRTEQQNSTAPVVNKYGVKVGDLFYMSWGWEQTNIDMFQVVALAGASSVRVRHVSPKIAQQSDVSGMSRHVSFEIPAAGEILPPSSCGFFVKDQARGDLHKLNSDGANGCYFKVDGRYWARPYHGGELYESWYA